MSRKVILVSDFFIEDTLRGAELANDALLHYLKQLTNITIETSKCSSLQGIDPNAFYLISNFVTINENHKNDLIRYKNYMIYEHDHKYVATRNPFAVPYGRNGIEVNEDGMVNPAQLINVDFYKNAKIVMCQTEWHMNQVQKNIKSNNFDNIHGSLYTPASLSSLETILSSASKKNICGIFAEVNGYKNHEEAMLFCKNNDIPFRLIPRFPKQEQFLRILAGFESFAFFPKIPESCSRLLIEARLLDCHVYTNKNSGIVNEPYWNLNNQDFREHIQNVVIPDAVNKFRRYLNG